MKVVMMCEKGCGGIGMHVARVQSNGDKCYVGSNPVSPSRAKWSK